MGQSFKSENYRLRSNWVLHWVPVPVTLGSLTTLIKNSVINIKLVRLSAQQSPKVGARALKSQVKKIKLTLN